MNTATVNREWNFIIKEINSSNKGGTAKGLMLFEFQILLSALSRVRNSKEKQIMASIYRKRKEQYNRFHN